MLPSPPAPAMPRRSSTATLPPRAPPSPDDGPHTLICTVCHARLHLGSRYCDQCGKRLNQSRINEAPLSSTTPTPASFTASPISPLSSSHTPALPRRLWDRPLPSIASARSNLRALTAIHSLLSSLLTLDRSYIQAVTKLTCAVSSEGMQSGVSEGWSFTVQHFVDRVRGKWREVERIERSLTALTDTIRAADTCLQRYEKEVADHQRTLKKAVDSLHKQEAKKHSQRSSAPTSSLPTSNPSFSRWHLGSTADLPHEVGTATSTPPVVPSTKLQTAQLAEHRVRAAHNACVTSTLAQLERLQCEQVEVMRAVLAGLMAEISVGHMRAYQSAVTVKDRVDAIDPLHDVHEWVRSLESGTPCTWLVPQPSIHPTPLASIIRSLRDDSGASAGNSQKGSSRSGGDSGSPSPSPTPRSLSSSVPSRADDSVLIPSPPQLNTARGVSGSTIGPASTSVSFSPSASHVNGDGLPPRQTSAGSPARSTGKPSPRVMSDSHHQLVLQPSRLLRLDHIASPVASAADVSDYLPWLPPHPALVGYHVEGRQWEMAAFETLLLSSTFLTPGVEGGWQGTAGESAQSVALGMLREKLGLTPVELTELMAALHSPTRVVSASALTSFQGTLNYRLLLLRCVDEDVFSSLKTFNAFYQRQCHVILAALLWRTVNLSSLDGPQAVKEWHHHGKTYTTEKMQSKVIERVKALADVYCDAGDRYVALRKERCDAVFTLLEEIVRDERGEGLQKKDTGGLLARVMGRKDNRREDDAAPDTLVNYPRQLRCQFFRELVAACVVKATAFDPSPPHTPPQSPPLTSSEAESQSPPVSRRQGAATAAVIGGEKEVEESMAVLHPRYGELLSTLAAFASYYHLSPLFVSLCWLHTLFDLVHDQAVVHECSPLATPAMRASDAVLRRMEEEVAHLKERREAEEERTDEDESLSHFCDRSLQHFDAQLSSYLSHYHQCSAAILSRVCSLYSGLLQLLHPPSSSSTAELERVYLREKKIVRILQRSVTVEYGRLRSAFTHMEPRHWAQLADEVVRLAKKEQTVYHRALLPITHTSLDITLPTLCTLFYTEMTAAVAEHPSADPFFVAVLPALTQVDEEMRGLSRVLADPYLLTSALPLLEEMVHGHLRHFISLQVVHVQDWVTKHVENERWMAVDETLGCSSSIIDTLHLLYTAVDAFYTPFAALFPRSAPVVPFFLQALNECLNHYCTLLHISCGDEAAVQPPLLSSTFATSVLTRAKSILTTDGAAIKPAGVPLSHQSLQSLCVRLCNVSVAKDRLTGVHNHLLERWVEMKGDWTGDSAVLLTAEVALAGTRDTLATTDAEVLTLGPFANAYEHACQCQQALLSLVASRVVYVDWSTPLLTVLYLPLPSSPAVNFHESGLMELLDSTMVDLFKMCGAHNFSLLVEWVYRYLLHSLQWTLLGRDRPKGQGLLEAGVISSADLEVLEEDWKEMKELFVDDLGEERMVALGAGYEAVLQKLRYRAQSNLASPKLVTGKGVG